jgi:recombination protein RecA
VIAEAQKKGGIAAFIDVEHALDPAYAETGRGHRQSAGFAARLRRAGSGNHQHADRSGQIDVLVVDSVAALVPKPNSRAKWATATWACRRG